MSVANYRNYGVFVFPCDWIAQENSLRLACKWVCVKSTARKIGVRVSIVVKVGNQNLTS